MAGVDARNREQSVEEKDVEEWNLFGCLRVPAVSCRERARPLDLASARAGVGILVNSSAKSLPLCGLDYLTLDLVHEVARMR